MDFDLEYLKDLLQETVALRKQFPFSEPDEDGCEITYLPTKLRIYWGGRIDSLYFRHEKEKCGVAEKPMIRKNCKHYFRIVRKDGKLLRIDTIINGRLDVIQLAHYEGDKRYCFPFSQTGGFYPTYVDVVRYEEGEIVEDYMVENVQILHRAYRKTDNNTIEFREINYVPSGIDPVRSKEIGYFTLNPNLTYTSTYNWTHWDDKK